MGLLTLSVLAGVIIGGDFVSVQSGKIFIPITTHRKVMFNPNSYSSDLPLAPGQSGSFRQDNIMQVIIYIDGVQLSASTIMINTISIFSSLNITVLFNNMPEFLNGLQNQTVSVSLPRGTYSVSLLVAYTTRTDVPIGQTGVGEIDFL